MKAIIDNKTTETPSINPPSISFAEILLILTYFLLAWFLPTSWLDTVVGNISFGIARTINPYLSEHYIAFAANPSYFIHCHVIATVIVFPSLYPLTIIRCGGLEKLSKIELKIAEKRGGLILYGMIVIFFVPFLYFGLTFFVDYPLSRAANLFCVSNVAFSALMMAGVLSIGVGKVLMIIYLLLIKN